MYPRRFQRPHRGAFNRTRCGAVHGIHVRRQRARAYCRIAVTNHVPDQQHAPFGAQTSATTSFTVHAGFTAAACKGLPFQACASAHLPKWQAHLPREGRDGIRSARDVNNSMSIIIKLFTTDATTVERGMGPICGPRGHFPLGFLFFFSVSASGLGNIALPSISHLASCRR